MSGDLGGDAPERLVKTMALTRAEFEKSVAVLSDAPVMGEGAALARLSLTKGEVDLTFTPLPRVRLGGLLEMPQARVEIAFRDVEQSEREAFLARFDLAFQRGGG